MIKNSSLPKIYIDALALVPQRKSGIGNVLEQTLTHLLKLPQVKERNVYLVVPLWKAKYLQRFVQPGVKIKTIYLPARALAVLLRLNILPPLDLFLGRGVYLFPNYRNWPLWSSRSITYIYDLGYLRFPSTVQPKNRAYLERHVKRWVARTDKIVTISQQVKDELEIYLHVAYNKISVIYCGVDGKLFYRRRAEEIAIVKERYSIPFKDYLLFVGNIEPRKNLIALLDAYLQLPLRQQQKYGLVLIGGGGWLNEEFHQRLASAQVDGKDVLKVEKYVESKDLPALYSGASALLLPSVYEGFGIPPLEAMACGTPAIVSDVPAIREVVQDAGYYFDPNRTDTITRAIIHALKDEGRTDLIRLGEERARQLNWDMAAADLEQVITDELSFGNAMLLPLRTAITTYRRIDLLVRSFLGEKVLAPYRPSLTSDKSALRAEIYVDFLGEQPSRAQTTGLKIYQYSKHVVASGLKYGYHALKGRGRA